jgi:GNAT superfamily N-acetyltransferase
MPQSITVRPATLADVPGIREIHDQAEDPWADIAECAIWTNHRLLTGFLIDVATVGGKVVGHAEWIASDEPEPFGRHLYLGMIEIHPRYQRRGVGRKMIEAGLDHARQHDCAALRTHPDDQARGFYQKCQFRCVMRAVSVKVSKSHVDLPPGWRKVRTVPRKVIGEMPMRSGWVQGSSVHMWELCNRTMAVHGEDVRHPCAGRLDGKGYVQLRYIEGFSDALCVSWAPARSGLKDHVQVAQKLAERIPIEKITFVVLDQDTAGLARCAKVKPVKGPEIWDRRVG